MDDPLLVDRPDLSGAGDLPAHMRIGHWLEQLIVSNTLEPGDKLPSEVEISNALGVSRMTLRQALSSIEAKAASAYATAWRPKSRSSAWRKRRPHGATQVVA